MKEIRKGNDFIGHPDKGWYVEKPSSLRSLPFSTFLAKKHAKSKKKREKRKRKTKHSSSKFTSKLIFFHLHFSYTTAADRL